VINITLWPLYTRERRLGGSHNWSGRFAEENIPFPAGIWIPDRPGCRPVEKLICAQLVKGTLLRNLDTWLLK